MEHCNINFEDAIIVENRIWFFAADFNGLFSVDLSDQRLTFRGRVPWEDEFEDALYNSLIAIGEKIYLIPFKAKSIAVYDMLTEEFSSMELQQETSGESQFISEVCLNGNDILLFHFGKPKVLVMNMITGEISELQSWKEKVLPYVFDKEEICFRKQYVSKSGRIYIPFCNANAILCIDHKTYAQEVYVLGEEAQGYTAICLDGEDMWLIPRRGNANIISWNPESGCVKKIKCPNEDDAIVYLGIEKKGDIIYAYSNLETKKFPEDSVVQLEPHRCSFVKRLKDCVMELDIDTGYLKLFYEGLQKQTFIPVCVEYKEIAYCNMFKGKQLKESEVFSVQRFLDAIEVDESERKVRTHNVGEKIYWE